MNAPTLFDGIERIEIFVEGKPFTKGSLTPFLVNSEALVNGGLIRSRKGKLITKVRPKWNMTEGSTDKARAARKAWRKAVTDAVAWEWYEKVGKKIPANVPVRVDLFFLFRRPVSIKASKRPRPTSLLDIDKLERMILDCMTDAKVYEDDGQVCKVSKEKDYATETSTTGVRIRVSAM